MKTKILVIGFLLIFTMACKKNTYNTKPTLVVKSMNGNVFDNDGVLIIQLQVTDKEGDVSNDLFVKRLRLNQIPLSNRVTDTFHLKVPTAPNSTDGIIQLQFDYATYLPDAVTPLVNDTIAFRFSLKDKADNVSDSVTTDPIVVIRH